MDDINEIYNLFPEIKENIFIEKKVGQGNKFEMNRGLDKRFLIASKKIIYAIKIIFVETISRGSSNWVATKTIFATREVGMSKWPDGLFLGRFHMLWSKM